MLAASFVVSYHYFNNHHRCVPPDVHPPDVQTRYCVGRVANLFLLVKA
jgi:hypothetical protein